jgi:hypothetical protein
MQAANLEILSVVYSNSCFDDRIRKDSTAEPCAQTFKRRLLTMLENDFHCISNRVLGIIILYNVIRESGRDLLSRLQEETSSTKKAGTKR